MVVRLPSAFSHECAQKYKLDESRTVSKSSCRKMHIQLKVAEMIMGSKNTVLGNVSFQLDSIAHTIRYCIKIKLATLKYCLELLYICALS